jgi:replication initiation protein RepC
MIRDILFHRAANMQTELTEHAYRSLRRSMSADQLQKVFDQLSAELPPAMLQETSATTVLSASDSQNDRHIQRSNKEAYESEAADEENDISLSTAHARGQPNVDGNDITVSECMEMAKNSAALASEPARDWADIVKLSTVLAPALGLERSDVDLARQTMGPLGCALAILGLVEAFEKIRNPRAYLRALTTRAREEGLDFVRMFRSLASSGASRASVSYAK